MSSRSSWTSMTSRISTTCLRELSKRSTFHAQHNIKTVMKRTAWRVRQKITMRVTVQRDQTETAATVFKAG